MASDVVMPRLSDSMEEGTVLKWLIEEGGEVKRGEALVEIETDKANMTYDADTDGVLVEIVAQEGDTLPIGEVIARIGEAGEAKQDGKQAEAEPEKAEQPEAQAEPEEAEADEAEQQPAETEEAPAVASAEAGGGETEAGAGTATRTRPAEGNGAGDGGRVKASPVARRMARELGVELARLEGTGPGGRIVKADVEAAAGGTQAPAAAPSAEAPRVDRAPAPGPETAKGEGQTVELNRLQATVARRMAESKATIPHFYLSMEIDMSEAVKLRARLKEIAAENQAVPTFNDMVVKACARALRDFPRANGSYRDGHLELYSRVNVGIAVAAQDALVVPTVFDADSKSLGEIAARSRELAERVRDGEITPPELSGGTFTVSNLGMFGISNFSAVINPPQAAILAVGALEPKAVVDRETRRVAVRDMMGVTLACDHRILYGADGAIFLGRVRELLTDPIGLAL
jgi:pyruvate dehydrogenase E2 component (dihydrolipoamide acetyltransferase)